MKIEAILIKTCKKIWGVPTPNNSSRKKSGGKEEFKKISLKEIRGKPIITSNRMMIPPIVMPERHKFTPRAKRDMRESSRDDRRE